MNAMRCFLALFAALPAAVRAAEDPPTKSLIDPPKSPAAVLEEPMTDIPISDKLFFPVSVFAAQHRPFVMFGGPEAGKFRHQVVNLKDGSVVGVIEGTDFGKVALSPDGSQIANMARGLKNV